MFLLLYLILGVVISLTYRFAVMKRKTTVRELVLFPFGWPVILIVWFFVADFWEKEI